MTNPPSSVFPFPAMTEENLRSARVRAFGVAACFALAPYFINVFWHGLTTFEFLSHSYGIPDLAFAGVVLLISALMNTVFSFTKASGWKATGRLTVWMIGFSCATAVACFLTYLKALDPQVASADLGRLFYSALVLALATLISCLTMQYTFLADECKAARENLTRLSPRQTRGTR